MPGPSSVTHEDFFAELYRYLCMEESIQQVKAIPEALVPLIKMRMGSIRVDLAYCSLPVNRLTTSVYVLMKQNFNGKSLDMKSIRSRNGELVMGSGCLSDLTRLG